MQSCKETDRKTCREAKRESDMHAERQGDNQTGMQTDKETDRKTCRQAKRDRQAFLEDREVACQTGGLTAPLHSKLLPTEDVVQEVLHVEGTEAHQAL